MLIEEGIEKETIKCVPPSLLVPTSPDCPLPRESSSLTPRHSRAGCTVSKPPACSRQRIIVPLPSSSLSLSPISFAFRPGLSARFPLPLSRQPHLCPTPDPVRPSRSRIWLSQGRRRAEDRRRGRGRRGQCGTRMVGGRSRGFTPPPLALVFSLSLSLSLSLSALVNSHASCLSLQISDKSAHNSGPSRLARERYQQKENSIDWDAVCRPAAAVP